MKLKHFHGVSTYKKLPSILYIYNIYVAWCEISYFEIIYFALTLIVLSENILNLVTFRAFKVRGIEVQDQRFFFFLET